MKRCSPDQIVSKLRQADVELGRGLSVVETYCCPPILRDAQRSPHTAAVVYNFKRLAPDGRPIMQKRGMGDYHESDAEQDDYGGQDFLFGCHDGKLLLWLVGLSAADQRQRTDGQQPNVHAPPSPSGVAPMDFDAIGKPSTVSFGLGVPLFQSNTCTSPDGEIRT